MNQKALLTGLALLGIIAIAAWFRFYDLHNYPPGLFPDQAANGEDVLLILDGDVRPFYPRGNGREALFFLLQAGFVKTFGIGVWPMFAASATVGLLTVVALFFATRVFFGRLAGLLAALLLATNHWHVTLSRTGFRAIMIPLCIAAFTAFVGYTIDAVGRGQRIRSLIYAAGAGASFAAGFYTYIAYRMMIGIVVGIVFVLLLAALHPAIGFPHARRYRWQLLVAILVGIIVLLPLGMYFAQHPADFIGRAGQVSVFSPDLQREYGGGELIPTIIYSLRATLLSFFAGEGDLNWRHNVAGYPLLNPLVGIWLLLGIAWAIHGTVLLVFAMVRGKEMHLGMVHLYLLLLLGGMLVPVITTAEGMPHGLRSIGLVVPIFMLAGMAGAVCVHWLKLKVHTVPLKTMGYGAVAGLLLVMLFYDYSRYFMITRNDAEAHYAYRADLTEVSKYINEYRQQYPDAPRPYLVLDAFSLQTVHYLTSVAAHDHVVGDEIHPDEELHKWFQVDPAQSHLINLEAGETIIFTQSTIPDAERFMLSHPDVELVLSRRNKFNQEIMRIYRQPGQVEGTIDRSAPEGNALDA